MIDIDELRRSIQSPEHSFSDAFSILRKVSRLVSIKGDDGDVVDLVVRIVSQRESFIKCSESFNEIIDGLARGIGLNLYIQDSTKRWTYEFVKNLYRSPFDEKITLHKEQAEVFNLLARGKSVLLSAPTSFGKSILIDYTIMTTKSEVTLIVVPTISLLDETRRRLKRNVDADYQIITLNSQKRRSRKAIYIGTQERLLEREDLEYTDLLVIDEFYKLNVNRDDERSTTLNVLLSKFLPRAKQIYMLGPPTESLNNETGYKDIVRKQSKFSPVSSDTIDMSHRRDPYDALVEVLNLNRLDANLIFCGSPKRANSLGHSLSASIGRRKHTVVNEISKWLSINYHPSWSIILPLENGIGIHHGRVPRSIAQLFVELFNKNLISTMICTSTLIEGVNTAAKNVYVYDKTIDGNSNMNKFEFQNIKGRAGRMGMHLLGRIYLFYSPPSKAEPEIFIPALESDRTPSDKYLMLVPNELLGTIEIERKAEIIANTIVPKIILERWSRFGIRNLEIFTRFIWEKLDNGDRSMIWSGWGNYNDIASCADVIWSGFQFEKHGISSRQFTFFSHRLRKTGNVKETLAYITSKDNDRFPVGTTIENFFSYLKGAEYIYPNMFDLLQDIIYSYKDEDFKSSTNYDAFSSSLKNWFLPGCLKGFDEYGIPLPLIQKVQRKIDHSDFDLAMDQFKSLANSDAFTEIEKRIIGICLDRR